MRHAHLALLLLLPLTAVAAETPAPNPLLSEWKTPFGVPPFDQIKDEHFLPAFQEGMKRQREEVATIATAKEPPTFTNTIAALERSGGLLDRVDSVFSNLNAADTNERRQATAREVAPLQAALQDDVLLDPLLFARVKAVWEQRDKLGLDAPDARLLELTFKRFVRGGANLGPEQQQRLRAINQELSSLGVAFGENQLKETNAFKLVIEKKDDLAGLPERLVQSAAEAAKAAGLDGKWVFTLQAPSIFPFLENSSNRELRRQILEAYLARGSRDGERDNRKVAARVATLRAERAQLLGYRTHADFILEERMARTPQNVYGLLDRLWKPGLAMAQKEAADLQAAIAEEGQDFQLAAWDWRYYAEKVRRARYEYDESELRPYFSLDNVRAGAFHLAGRLYGLTFTERKDLPVYHPEVKAFEVKEKDGRHLGVFYVDYHPRPGKRSGAWSSRYREHEVEADGRVVTPVVVNVSNYSRPAGDQPALLSLDETETLFHEFGHGLHSLVSRVRYKSFSTLPRDFVEMPSQVLENWVLEPEVLAVYAKHWKTGAPIPAALVERVKQARKFNQGFATVEYLAASYLDLDWHTLTAAPDLDALAFERRALGKIGLPDTIPSRYRTPYFQHIFAGGYSAGYYGYVWSEVLDADIYQLFKEKGIFDPATALSFRQNILEPGNGAEAIELFKRFRGREPSVEALLERRGLK
jgi:peptidyl-dipeptidase Dcp